MSRRNTAEEVEVPEVEETVETQETESKPKDTKAKKEPSRGALPEGYVTPVGLTKEINERGLHTNKAGEKATLAPQMTYSYIKNAPAEFPFPMETVTDSLGHERQAVKVEAGIEWWEAKIARAAERRSAAAAKASEKAAKAKAKSEAVEVEVEDADTEVTEAE